MQEERQEEEKKQEVIIEGEWRQADGQKQPEPKKKGRRWIWMVIIIALVITASLICVELFWPEKTLVIVYLVEPVNESSVQGPLTRVKFSTDEKIKPSELTTLSVKNSEGRDFVGNFSDPKKKVKEFYWTPDSPLKAGIYNVEVNGKNVWTRTFSFTVFEVEKINPPKTPASAQPSTPAGLNPSRDTIL
ncbi:MAG: hypothetical protein PHE77_02940 [Candidatus Pacebacteria bacterium]|nr:hypothetical protein [Candidatus Paceibacterota bacterium]